MPTTCLHLLLSAAVAAAAVAPAAAQRGRQTAPETFTAQVQSRTGAGAIAGSIRIHVERYTPEAERQKTADALEHGGYPAFVPALRSAPEVGWVEVGDVKVTVRWAREEPSPKGRTIVLVTEQPVYFVGGGRAQPKSREGFEVAVVRLAIDDIGMGEGTIAAAAKIKPDGQGGVAVEDYADEPLKLTFVGRVIE
jgi:hypothetical protein